MGSDESPLIVIAGPTASGKTDVAIAVARRIGAEIISADSRQVYRGLDIGTAKPAPEQLAVVRHHGIDVCDPPETYTAGRFVRDAQGWDRDIRQRGRRGLLVGGTGMYIQAFIDGLFEGPEADPALRARLEGRRQEEGLGALVEELRALDPEAAAVIDTRNPVRVIRALEVCLLTGKRYSALRVERMPARPRAAVWFGLRHDRATLHARIGRRVDAMIADGFVEEVRHLLAAGADPSWTCFNGVGYPQIINYLEGSATLDQSIDAIKAGTRQYARRQFTWFRKEERLRWIDVEEGMAAEDIAGRIVEMADGQ